jgi:hypothetical protein
MTDATGCTSNLNQNFNFNYNVIDATLATPVYNCDSNKTLVHFNLQGNAPWIINYTYNGAPVQINTASASVNLFLTNGTYQFLNVTDATGCNKSINQVYTFNYQTFSATISQQLYDCDSNKYRYDFALTGNAPWTILYQDGIGNQFTQITSDPTPSLFLSNGNWTINSIYDLTGCGQWFNTSIFINYTPIAASITSQSYDCDSNKLRVNLSLQGLAPWNIQYINTATSILTSINTIDPNESIYLPNGIYQFVQVSDNAPCYVPFNQITSNFYTPLTIQKTNTSYNCDSNKVKIDYSLSGDGPWTIQYKNLNGGTIFSQISVNPFTSIYLPSGDYVIQSVTDLKCTKVISDTIHINFPALTGGISPYVIACDSGKMSTSINILSGLKPYSLHYTYNNVPSILYTNQNATPFYLTNGTYYLNSIKDSVGCELVLNNSYQANYNPFEYTGINSTYNCSLDSTAIQLSFTGQSQLNLVYRKDNLPYDTLNVTHQLAYNVSNGSYKLFYVFDALGCVDSINTTLDINHVPIQISIDSITPNCDDKVHAMKFSAQGQAPWSVYYNLDNKQDTLVLYNSTSYWNALSGEYYFINAVDATGCMYNMQQAEQLAPFIDFSPILTTDFKRLSVTPSPYKQLWYKDGIIIDSISKNNININGDGSYYVIIIDSAGCEYQSNSIVIDFPELINLYPNPAHNTTSILINEDYGNYWQYAIVDTWGNVVEKGLVEKNYKELNISLLSEGIYSIIINYENANNKKVFRLIKN